MASVATPRRALTSRGETGDAMTQPSGGNGTTGYRLDNLERDVRDLKTEIRSSGIDVLKNDVHYIKEDVEQMRKTQIWIFRILATLATSIIGGAILYAVTQANSAGP